ncbi:MAG: Ig-like domain-containing protein, partial [Aquihabitans sp.]
MIAFLMGMIGHGMGDEVWDWLFEPYVADLEEYYTPSSLGGQANEGGAELQLDLVAIADFGQPTSKIVRFPSHPDLLAAFKSVGMTGIDDSQLNLGEAAMDVVHDVEAQWAPTHIDDLHKAMPWTSHNVVTAPGGVNFAATAIAGEWNVMWGRLLGEQPATSVSITYPADGQLRIPATGWDRNMQPGSSRGRGGARNRITAVLTYARPYTGSAGTSTNELPAGSMTLVERDSGDAVPIMAGWPRSVPYGADAGEHMVDIQPAGNLKPCTWYTAGVTANLVDARNLPVVPVTWDFRTGTDGNGNRCEDDPYNANEKFVRKVTSDLLDRPATEQELQAANYSLERGTTRRTFTSNALASTEE